MSDFTESINALKGHLLGEGINPSFQRLKIYKYIKESKAHPTVDQMFNELSREIPTLSKTTIYNTLNLFQEKGLVAELTIESKEVRYDGDTKPHAHFKCSRCGRVYDVAFSLPDMANAASGHRVDEYHLYLRGTCRACLHNDQTA